MVRGKKKKLFHDFSLLSSTFLSRGRTWGNTSYPPPPHCPLLSTHARRTVAMLHETGSAGTTGKSSVCTYRDLSEAIIFLLSRMLAIFNQAGKHSYARSETNSWMIIRRELTHGLDILCADVFWQSIPWLPSRNSLNTCRTRADSKIHEILLLERGYKMHLFMYVL